MSILANSLGVTRYRVTDSQPLFGAEINLETAQDALAKFGFVSILENNNEHSTGWVQCDNQEAASFTNPGTLWIGDFLAFSLRRDSRSIPALIFNAEMKKEFDAFLDKNPNFRGVPKVKREEIKEALKDRLLYRQLPDSQVWDIVWDIKGSMIYLFNTSGKAMETFEIMFKKTFTQFSLQYYTPWHQAEDICKASENALSYDLEKSNRATSKSAMDLIKSNAWLGKDLLLWLLSGQCQSGQPDLSAWVDCKIDLAGLSSEGGIEKITVTGSQNEMPAIKSALKNGSYITKAGVFIEDSDGQKFAMVVTGDTFALSQFKTPTVMVERLDDQLAEFQATFLEKMHLIQKGISYFTSVYSLFLNLRLSYEWDDQSRTIRDWMED